MNRTLTTRIGAALSATTLGAFLILSPSAAQAAVTTTVGFVSAAPTTAAFGDDWLITLYVESSFDGGPTLRLTPTDGTVDVYLAGIGGAFASGLPIQPDGTVYFSQPIDKPLLGTGNYDVTAIYNPPTGGYYSSSQTATAATLTIDALTVEPIVEVAVDPTVSENPVITASIAGSYSEAIGGAPAGTWHFTVTDKSNAILLDADFPQEQGSTEPVRVEIPGAVATGQSYSIASSFTPVEELAQGLTVSEVASTNYAVPAGGALDILSAPAAVPLWLTIILGITVLGLIATSIALGVRLRSRTPRTTAERAAPRIPGDPGEVHIMSLNEVGLPEPETVPDIFAEEAPTVKLPDSTTWLLSDVEPATSVPSASEAPTERIEAIISEPTPTADADDAKATETPAETSVDAGSANDADDEANQEKPQSDD